jgi:hypothetical protein
MLHVGTIPHASGFWRSVEHIFFKPMPNEEAIILYVGVAFAAL